MGRVVAEGASIMGKESTLGMLGIIMSFHLRLKRIDHHLMSNKSLYPYLFIYFRVAVLLPLDAVLIVARSRLIPWRYFVLPV